MTEANSAMTGVKPSKAATALLAAGVLFLVSAVAAPVDLTNKNFDDNVRQRSEDSWMVFELFASW